MKSKSTLKVILFLVFALVSMFSLSACTLFDVADFEPLEDAMELVGSPTMTYSYNEETGYYDVYVEGIAKNVSESAVSNASVTFAVYDASGNLICVAEDYIAVIDVGLSWRFAATGTARYAPAQIELLDLCGYDW